MATACKYPVHVSSYQQWWQWILVVMCCLLCLLFSQRIILWAVLESLSFLRSRRCGLRSECMVPALPPSCCLDLDLLQGIWPLELPGQHMKTKECLPYKARGVARRAQWWWEWESCPCTIAFLSNSVSSSASPYKQRRSTETGKVETRKWLLYPQFGDAE